MELYPYVELQTLLLVRNYLGSGDDCISDALGLPLSECLSQNQAKWIVQDLDSKQYDRRCLMILAHLIEFLEQPSKRCYFTLILLVKLLQIVNYILTDLPRSLRRIIPLKINPDLVKGDIL